MQRVRQSLPYFRRNGWEPTVITVDDRYVEAYSTDELLLQTFPADIKIHKVRALKASVTRKFGIGSLSMRSFFSIKKKGDELLGAEHFDLIFFSTTAFHVMALGPRWKKKFRVPFVLDIQDPWYNTFYFRNALAKKTAKAWAYHRLDKHLEAKTIPLADGIISVSAGYRDLYLKRYPKLLHSNFCILPFGCAEIDFKIAESIKSSAIEFRKDRINVVYIGRGGQDMKTAIEIIFDAIVLGLKNQTRLFQKLQFWFIGTDYAAPGKGLKSIEPIAQQKGIGNHVTEITDRKPYFETLYLLSKANMLLVPGSTDPAYTASKIYPYIYINKPMLSVFHANSSVGEVIRNTSGSKVVTFQNVNTENERSSLVKQCFDYFLDVLNNDITNGKINQLAFEEYTAKSMASKQIKFFNDIVNKTTQA